MWLCSSCFDKCEEMVCNTCQVDIRIKERYLLKHCIKVVPRMCFEALDTLKNTPVVVYQCSSLDWEVVLSPDVIDIRKATEETKQYREPVFRKKPTPFKRNRKLEIIEQQLDPLDTNGDSQFVIHLPEKRGWWNQDQNKISWNSSTIHPAFLLLFFVMIFFIVSVGILLFLMNISQYQ